MVGVFLRTICVSFSACRAVYHSVLSPGHRGGQLLTGVVSVAVHCSEGVGDRHTGSVLHYMMSSSSHAE